MNTPNVAARAIARLMVCWSLLIAGSMVATVLMSSCGHSIKQPAKTCEASSRFRCTPSAPDTTPQRAFKKAAP